MIGASDMGTGCDTILSQMAAECLDCEMDEIIVHGVDTDSSPYDTGSYASSTTYVTGMAVVRTCETLKDKLCEKGAQYLGCDVDDVDFDGQCVVNIKTGASISRAEIGNRVMCNNEEALYASEAYSSPVSPPPFMVGMAEVEIDKETGELELIDYVAVVDCGTVVNPSLARVQTEGGLAQGIGMAMYEDVIYNAKGKNYSNSFMQYKIPSRLDVGNIRVEFEQLRADRSVWSEINRRDRDQYAVPCDCKCSQPCGRSKSERTSNYRRKSVLGDAGRRLRKISMSDENWMWRFFRK